MINLDTNAMWTVLYSNAKARLHIKLGMKLSITAVVFIDELLVKNPFTLEPNFILVSYILICCYLLNERLAM